MLLKSILRFSKDQAVLLKYKIKTSLNLSLFPLKRLLSRWIENQLPQKQCELKIHNPAHPKILPKAPQKNTTLI